MEDILAELQGANVVCHMDDILIWGKDKQEHEKTLKMVIEKLRAVGMTLNREKCVFKISEVRFLGHIISTDGISLDPEQVTAILQME